MLEIWCREDSGNEKLIPSSPCNGAVIVDSTCGKMLHFVVKTLRYIRIYDSPMVSTVGKVVLRFLVFLDNPYAVVAANCSKADHVLDAMCWNTCWH